MVDTVPVIPGTVVLVAAAVVVVAAVAQRQAASLLQWLQVLAQPLWLRDSDRLRLLRVLHRATRKRH